MNSKNVKLAVLLTCFNRRDQTLTCLNAVYKQQYTSGLMIDIYMVDDGSTDGTSEAVKKMHPDVIVLKGNGDLYWNGGMRLAFQTAIDVGYDFYLWLNDDSILYDNAIENLLKYTKTNVNSILVGSVCDPVTKEHTYGGVRQVSRLSPLKFGPVYPLDNKLIPCDTMNGNCVLIPKTVVNILGNLSPEFTHGIGDFDYGLRAKEQGIALLVISGFVGECSRNSLPNCFNSNVPLVKRLKYLYSPKGLPPNEWVFFAKRHAYFLWPLYYIKLLIRVLFA